MTLVVDDGKNNSTCNRKIISYTNKNSMITFSNIYKNKGLCSRQRQQVCLICSELSKVGKKEADFCKFVPFLTLGD